MCSQVFVFCRFCTSTYSHSNTYVVGPELPSAHLEAPSQGVDVLVLEHAAEDPHPVRPLDLEGGHLQRSGQVPVVRQNEQPLAQVVQAPL